MAEKGNVWTHRIALLEAKAKVHEEALLSLAEGLEGSMDSTLGHWSQSQELRRAISQVREALK